MNREAKIAEYNNFYLKKPTKWTSEERNQLVKTIIEDYLDGIPPVNLLDIGCGNGHTIAYLSQHWLQTQFYGLDLSDIGIHIAQERNIKQAKFVVGFLGDVEFPVHFDLIILLGVAEHFENPIESLKQVKQLLLPGGIVYIEVPNCIAYPESRHEEGFRRITVGNRQFEWHLFRESWEKIFADAGFVIKKSIRGPRQQYEFIWILK